MVNSSKLFVFVFLMDLLLSYLLFGVIFRSPGSVLCDVLILRSVGVVVMEVEICWGCGCGSRVG